MDCPDVVLPERGVELPDAIQTPLPADEAAQVALAFGPNITPLPRIDPLADRITVPVLLALGDDVSTDLISPGRRRGAALSIQP